MLLLLQENNACTYPVDYLYISRRKKLPSLSLPITASLNYFHTYFEENNRESIRQHFNRFEENHPESIRQYFHTYFEENHRESIRQHFNRFEEIHREFISPVVRNKTADFRQFIVCPQNSTG